MSRPPHLYYMPRTRSSRVLWTLEELGEPYALTEIAGAERQSAEHLRRHPHGRVPVLELGDGTFVFESAAICLTLAERAPDAGLLAPEGSRGRALAYQWVMFSVAELEGPLFAWIRQLPDAPAESIARDRFSQAAAALESALAAGEWLIDGRFTVADVMCISVLEGADSRGLLEPWPGVAAYVHRGVARPAHARAAAIFDRPRR